VEALEEVEAVDVGHFDIEEDEVGGDVSRFVAAFEHVDRIMTAARCKGLLARPLKEAGEHVSHHVHVIDYHDRRHVKRLLSLPGRGIVPQGR